MKLTRRDKAADTDVEDSVDEAVNLDKHATTSKGRATPKRRDSEGRRGPVVAPKTRKEAYARQKQLSKQPKRKTGVLPPPRSASEQRAAMKRGDPSALPRRDQGTTRKLARDYVDSKRMLSNYLLFLFPVMIAGTFIPALAAVQLLVLVLFLALLVEWFIVGKRIRAMAIERFGEAQGGPMSIGFYAGSRAYLPRKWRLPGPQVVRGEEF